MYFSLINFCARTDLKEFSLLTLSFQPREKGARHLLGIRWERIGTQAVFTIHVFWNWNRAWVSSE